MPISVASTPRIRGITAPLRAIVRATLELEGRKPGEIAIVLTDDATIRELNRRYRSIDRATDVLSFGYDDKTHVPERRGRRSRLAPPGFDSIVGRVAGDIVVSMDRVLDQAKRHRVSSGRELARLVVHGTLHLAGLDHQTAADRVTMRRREAQALKVVPRPIAGLDVLIGARRP